MRQQEGDYDERVVAKSKPVRNLVSRSHAEPSTTSLSMASSSLEKVGSKDHEIRFGKAKTEQLVVKIHTKTSGKVMQ